MLAGGSEAVVIPSAIGGFIACKVGWSVRGGAGVRAGGGEAVGSGDSQRHWRFQCLQGGRCGWGSGGLVMVAWWVAVGGWVWWCDLWQPLLTCRC